MWTQISWPNLMAAALVAALVAGLVSWSFQPRLARPVHRGLLARLVLRVHKARLDPKVFPVRVRRPAVSVGWSAYVAIAWADQFAEPAGDCH